MIQLGGSGQRYGPHAPHRAQAHALTDDQLPGLIRIWLANRGYGKHCRTRRPGPATRADVARYLQARHDLPAQLR